MTGTITPPPDYAQADPEVALMLRVQTDDKAAFGQLVARYWRGVNLHFRLTVSESEAEDLAQETFLRVYDRRSHYRPEAKFATWLFGIVRNVGRNALRSRRRKPVVPLERAHNSSHGSGIIDTHSDTPSRIIYKSELETAVNDALKKLRTRQREALMGQHFDEKTYVEIAESLELSPEATKSLLYRARMQLRLELEAKQIDGTR